LFKLDDAVRHEKLLSLKLYFLRPDKIKPRPVFLAERIPKHHYFYMYHVLQIAFYLRKGKIDSDVYLKSDASSFQIKNAFTAHY
jgi:hypothetical protein